MRANPQWESRSESSKIPRKVGRGWSTPVSHDYPGPFAFTGTLQTVTIEFPK